MQGFTNAIARAQQWVAAHTDREVAEAIADQFPDTDISVLETVTARHRAIDAWKLTPELEEQSLVNLQEVMEHAGELSRSQWVDCDRRGDNSWAKNAG